jgi:hypothetical protein
VVNLGESVSAKIDTLIDRAIVMVVDATSPYTQFELGLAVSRSQEESTRLNRQPLRIISVVTEFAQLQGASQYIHAIRRPQLLSDDTEFVSQLAKALDAIAEEMGLAQRHEPRRLFEAKEYRAAVIAAMTLLESELRQRLNTRFETVSRPMSLRHLLDFAAKEGMAWNQDVLGWAKLRNDVVHGGEARVPAGSPSRRRGYREDDRRDMIWVA